MRLLSIWLTYNLLLAESITAPLGLVIPGCVAAEVGVPNPDCPNTFTAFSPLVMVVVSKTVTR